MFDSCSSVSNVLEVASFCVSIGGEASVVSCDESSIGMCAFLGEAFRFVLFRFFGGDGFGGGLA